MLDAFVEIQDEFRTIAARFGDSDADMQKKRDYLEQSGAGD